MTPTVTILTYCAHPALAYGTLLVFKTLRTGFPTARVVVYDNGSHPEVKKQIEQAAADVGAEFHAVQKHYANHYEWLLLHREIDSKQLVILDPDVIFWENVEGWQFGDALIAGRLIPGIGESVVQVLPRLHPSLFWVPDWAALRQKILERSPTWEFVGPDAENVKGGRHLIMDTLAPLYREFTAQSFAFGEAQLDCYDHLFNGSHLPVLDMNQTSGFEAIRAGHEWAAVGDFASLRGIWRQQEAYFRSTERSTPLTGAQRQARLVPCAQEIQKLQGMECDADQLAGAMQGLMLKLLGGHPKVPRRPSVGR